MPPDGLLTGLPLLAIIYAYLVQNRHCMMRRKGCFEYLTVGPPLGLQRNDTHTDVKHEIHHAQIVKELWIRLDFYCYTNQMRLYVHLNSLSVVGRTPMPRESRIA